MSGSLKKTILSVCFIASYVTDADVSHRINCRVFPSKFKLNLRCLTSFHLSLAMACAMLFHSFSILHFGNDLTASISDTMFTQQQSSHRQKNHLLELNMTSITGGAHYV